MIRLTITAAQYTPEKHLLVCSDSRPARGDVRLGGSDAFGGGEDQADRNQQGGTRVEVALRRISVGRCSSRLAVQTVGLRVPTNRITKTSWNDT